MVNTHGNGMTYLNGSIISLWEKQSVPAAAKNTRIPFLFTRKTRKKFVINGGGIDYWQRRVKRVREAATVAFFGSRAKRHTLGSFLVRRRADCFCPYIPVTPKNKPSGEKNWKTQVLFFFAVGDVISRGMVVLVPPRNNNSNTPCHWLSDANWFISLWWSPKSSLSKFIHIRNGSDVVSS